jgi:hypothetical protein
LLVGATQVSVTVPALPVTGDATAVPQVGADGVFGNRYVSDAAGPSPMSDVFAFTVIVSDDPRVSDESAQVVAVADPSVQVTEVDPINTVT